MKATLLYVALFAVLLLVIPMLALSYDLPNSQTSAQVHSPVAAESIPDAKQPDTTQPASEISEPAEDETEPQKEVTSDQAYLNLSGIPMSEYDIKTFKILNQSTGEVVEVSARDFVRGAVAAEMPVSFHSEALKAQAVAAHTFALHNHIVQQQSPDPELKGADFAADPENMKVYITKETALDFYAINSDMDKAEAAWEKICAAADEALPYVLQYEDEPIVAAYHAISAGVTEDASNVWEGTAPYLLPVDSDGDVLAPDYKSSVTVTTDELRNALTIAYPEIQLEDDPAQWLQEVERSQSGYVTEIKAGDVVLHGKDIRQLLDLRSHNFEIEYTDAGFEFTVYGYGHGVGLSQYGADFMARQGSTFDDILMTYYTDAQLYQVET